MPARGLWLKQILALEVSHRGLTDAARGPVGLPARRTSGRLAMFVDNEDTEVSFHHLRILSAALTANTAEYCPHFIFRLLHWSLMRISWVEIESKCAHHPVAN